MKSDLNNILRLVKSILLWTLAIVAYYVAFQLFYNMVAYQNPLPYTGWRDMIYGASCA